MYVCTPDCTTCEVYNEKATGRFNEKVIKTDGCWLWQGYKSKLGYGSISYRGRPMYAHRFSLLLTRGLTDGYEVDHLCRNPPCVNPLHLEEVTHVVNMLRGECQAAKNKRKTHCKNGHEFNENNIFWAKGGGRRCRTCDYTRHRAYIKKRRQQSLLLLLYKALDSRT